MILARQKKRPGIGTPRRRGQLSLAPCGERSGVGAKVELSAQLRTPALSPRRPGQENRPHGIGSVLFTVVALAMLTLASMAVTQTAQVAFDLSIERGRVAANMRLIRVRQGDTVKLRWTTDRAIILHLHGYDIEAKVEPGAVTEMAFTARATGRFPIEEHRPNAKGGHSHAEAPLVRIEVYPR
jgi:hypothetical protein